MPETVLEFFTLISSGFATVITLYFWLVKSRKERPWLKVYWGGLEKASLKDGDTPGTVSCCYRIRPVVANYSVAPNAVLDVRGWVKGTDGNWVVAKVDFPDPPTRTKYVGERPLATDHTMPIYEEVPATDEKYIKLPFNVSGVQTVVLHVDLTVTAPKGPTEGDAPPEKRSLRAVAQPLEVKVELAAMGNQRFTNVIRAAS